MKGVIPKRAAYASIDLWADALVQWMELQKESARDQLPDAAWVKVEDISTTGGFGTGWSANSFEPMIFKDPLGGVHMTGNVIKCGPAPLDVMFTLPLEYCPAEQMDWRLSAGISSCRCILKTDGVFLWIGAGNAPDFAGAIWHTNKRVFP